MNKICVKCKIEQSINNFNYRRKGSLRRQLCCQSCIKKNKFKYALKRNYNLSVEDCNNILKNQSCAYIICQRQNIKLVVSYNQKTKTVRGLLCNRCNMLLGQFKYDIDAFKRIIHLLK